MALIGPVIQMGFNPLPTELAGRIEPITSVIYAQDVSIHSQLN